MRKRSQKWFVIVVIAIISITLLGTSFVAIFQPGMKSSAEDQKQEYLLNAYNERKQIVGLLSGKLEASPDDLQIQNELADAYFDRAIIAAELYPDEFEADLQEAMELYQKFLEQKDDNQVLLKLANTAFYLNDSETSEKAFMELLQKEPENPEALFGYGKCLFYFREDYSQALQNWQQALNLTEDVDFRQRIQEMIAEAQKMDSVQEKDK